MGKLEEIVQQLTESLGLSPYEARAYLTLIQYVSLREEELEELSGLPPSQAEGALEGLLAKGLTIRAPGQATRYAALHPRMALTNAFKALQDGLMRKMKERRMAVDRLARLLEPIYEKGRSAPRG